MPFYDRACAGCGQIAKDLWEPVEKIGNPICICGTPMLRALLPNQRRGVVADSIPGGVWIQHGLCNPDGTPKRYDSHSEINQAARERGLTNTGNKHAPVKGSDKALDGATTRWVEPSPISEEDRLKHWHAHEARLNQSSSR